MTKKGYLFLCSGFFAVTASMLVIGAFYDLKIDQTLYNPQSGFGILLRDYGELPVYVVILLSGPILFHTRNKEIRWKNVVLGICFVLFTLLWWYIVLTKFSSYFKRDAVLAVMLISIVVLTAISLFVCKFIPRSVLAKLMPLAVMGVMVGGSTALCVEVIKVTWGRVRFFHMVDSGDFTRFTPWYWPNGINGNNSFPSGHTSAASAIFMLVALTDQFKQWKKYELPLFILSVIYTFAVGFSRLIVGAHYLSDIAMGATIGFAFFILFRKYYLQNHPD